MIGIDELNSVILDLLIRYGNGTWETDLNLHAVLVAVIYQSASFGGKEDPVLALAVDGIGKSISFPIHERVAVLRSVSLEFDFPERKTNPSFQHESKELITESLQAESANALGNDDPLNDRIDFAFGRDFISLSILKKYGNQEELIVPSDFADAVLICDKLLFWSEELAKKPQPLLTDAVKDVSALFSLVQRFGIYKKSDKSQGTQFIN